MTDVKVLPDNLAEIAKEPEFQATYKAHTVEQLESKLRELNVAFLSADNKNELVWRLLDATQSEVEPVENAPANDDTTDSVVSTDDTAHDQTEEQMPEDEAAQSVIDEQPEATQVEAQESSENANTGEAELPPTDADTSSDSIDTPQADNSQPSPEDSVVNNNVDSIVDDTPKEVAPEVNQDAPKSDDTSNAKPEQEVKKDHDSIHVKNIGAFNVLEPATVTILVAGETIRVYPNARVSKEKILRNIEQFNKTRGNILKVID